MSAGPDLVPPGPEDVPAVFQALAARDAADFGDPSVSRELLLERWGDGRLRAGEEAMVARGGPSSVSAFAAVLEVGVFAFVHPQAEGQGIGSRLLGWSEQAAIRLGRAVHRQRIAQGNARARDLLAGAGYARVRTVWTMVHDLHALPPPPALPAGITLGRLDPEGDAVALHRADTEAFAENAEAAPESFEGFRDEHLRAATLDLEASTLARRGSAIAGYALCRHLPDRVGYIDLLAVAPGERRRGLGRAILHHALTRFAAGGMREARLETASDNPGGLALYRAAGMEPRYGAEVWEKPLAVAAGGGGS